jgi:TolB-like protein/Tfp pilus assembly protein PilF
MPFEDSDTTVREQLAKILSSRTFRSAEGQRAFLRYAVEEVLAGRGPQIKEYLIGVEVFHRGESFDPRLDPIVRTQARKLRAKLDKYYETEGALDSLRIDFLKGAYLPSFRSLAAVSAIPSEPVVPKPEVSEPVAASSAPPPDSHWYEWSWKSAALLLLVLVVAEGAWALLQRFRQGPPENRFGEPSASLLVMPFVNLGENHDDEFLSDGLAEDLIDSLGQISGLRVVARNSAFRFKGRNPGLKEIADTLHVRTVLEGAVRKSGDRLRITAHLLDVSNGYQLWSGVYDRESPDVRAIKREIVQSMTNVLGLSLPARIRESQTKSALNASVSNPGAYQSYLKGLYFWNKLTVPGLKAAMEYFEEAIAADPSFARAYVALADSYVLAPQVDTAPPPELVSRIKAAALKALELDSTLGQAHIDLAICAEYDYDWETAEKEFRTGLTLDPGNAVAHLWYAKLLALKGRKPEVLAQRLIAAQLDPVSPYTVQSVGGYFSVMGHYDEAIDHFENALALEPGFGLAHQGLGVAYLMKHEPGKAIEELQLANRLMRGPRRLGVLGYALGLSGRTKEAGKILQDLLDQSKREQVPASAIAHVYIGLGDKDRAFEWMSKAVDQKDLGLTLQWDSLYHDLRSDPRYTELLRRMKLG